MGGSEEWNSVSQAGTLADAFGRAAKSVGRAFDDRLGEHGVSTPRSKLLAEVDRLQPVRLADVARAVGISQGTASTLVEALVRDGLVVRTADSVDRRAVRLTTTPEGAAQAKAWFSDYLRIAEELFSSLAPAEQRALTDVLNRLADAVNGPPQN
jgi:DNA-binding MarR family transcriptional regulator